MSLAIADIRIHPISIPLARPFWMSLEPYTVAAEIVVEVETDDGLVGIGEIHGRPQAEIVRILDASDRCSSARIRSTTSTCTKGCSAPRTVVTRCRGLRRPASLRASAGRR